MQKNQPPTADLELDPCDIERFLTYTRIIQESELGIFALTSVEKWDFIALVQEEQDLIDLLHGHELSVLLLEQGFLHASDIVRAFTPKDFTVPATSKEMHTSEAMEGGPRMLIIGAYEPSELPVGRFAAPPFGLVRMGSFLKQFGVNADVYDVTQLGADELLRTVLAEGDYDYIGFSVLASTMPHDLELMHKIKKWAPEAKFVAGGQSATSRPDLMEEAPLDYLCLGYGEFPLLNLMCAHGSPEDEIAKIPGLMTRDAESGEFTIEKAAEVLENRDIAMFSACYDPSLIAPDSYWETNAEQYVDPEAILTLRVFTQTYCPHDCSFCSSKNFLKLASGQGKVGPLQQYIGDSARQAACVTPAELSPESFVNFLLRSIEKYPQVSTIFLNDDNLMINKSRFMEIADLIEANPRFLRIKFIASMRVDNVNEEILKRAAEIGIKEINFGVETFSRTGLASLSKGVRTPQGSSPAQVIRDAIDLARKHGITPSMNLLLFYPGVTFKEVHENMDNAIDYVGTGAKVNFATFIRAYFGADILSEGAPTESRAVLVDTDEGLKSFLIESRLFPHSEDMQKVANRSVEIRSLLEEQFKREYSWSRRRAPKEIIILLTFRAMYMAADEVGVADLVDYPGQLARIDEAVARLSEEQLGQITHPEPDISDVAAAFFARNNVVFNSIDANQVEGVARRVDALYERDLMTSDMEPLVAELISFQKDMFLERAHGQSWIKGDSASQKFDYFGMLFHVFEKSRYWHLNPQEKNIVMRMFVLEKGLALDDEKIRQILSVFGFSLGLRSERANVDNMLDYYLDQEEIVLFDSPGVSRSDQSDYFRDLFTRLRAMNN